MPKNTNLRRANKAKKDEFYTQLGDIENELKHYKEHFKGKVVYCNCDDPYESNFFKYFAMNFNFLGLKRLIATSYSPSPIAHTQLNIFGDKKSYKIEINEVYDVNCDGAEDLADVKYLLENGKGKNKVSLLEGDGDFRSEECKEILKKVDIVVTNPPFSLFREYLSQLVNYKKSFIIWGNNNAITYRDVFHLMKEDKLWLGYSVNKTCIFRLSNDYDKFDEKLTKQIDDGFKYGRVPAISIFTNLDIKKRHENLILYKKFSNQEYPKYDNFDAIDISRISDIPYDYEGIMGVPITFMDKYNPEQFELIGMAHGDMGQALGVSANFTDEKCRAYFHKNKAFRRGFVCYTDTDGKLIVPYMRILIRRKK